MDSAEEGGGLQWATVDLRFSAMKRIESTLEADGGYLQTISAPSMRPAELERYVLEFTEKLGERRKVYLTQVKRFLSLIQEGQSLGITKDEDLITVYWDGASSLSRGRESSPLEFHLPVDVQEDDPEGLNRFDGNSAGHVAVHNQNRHEWRSGKTVEEMVEYMLENDAGNHKDVTFFVGPRRIPMSAHKHFLTLVSIVFDYGLLESPHIVAAGPRNPFFMVIQYASPHTFKMLLKYVYCRRVDWTPDSDGVTEAMCLLKLSQRFQMLDLVKRCVAQIRDNTTEQNAPGVLQNAYDLHQTELTKFAVDFIVANGRRILFVSQFKKLSPECFSMILEKDQLNMAELTVLNAAVRWAEHRIHSRSETPDVKISGETIRAELGPLLYLIRFPLLDREAFGRHVLSEHSGLLDMSDEVAFHRFGLGFNAAPFCARPRIHDSHPSPPAVQLSTAEDDRLSGISAHTTSRSPLSTGPTFMTQTSTGATTTAATHSAEQLDRISEEHHLGATSSNIAARPMDIEVNLAQPDIEEEMEALFQDVSNLNSSGEEQPPRKVMKSGSQPVDTCTTSNNNNVVSPQLSIQRSVVVDSPSPVFQPPPAIPSTSSGVFNMSTGRPLRAKKAPQRFIEADDTPRSRRRQSRGTVTSMESSSVSQGSEDESNSFDLEQEQQFQAEELDQPDKRLLNEMQSDYIKKYGAVNCENDLNSFYQTLCVMLEDSCSQINQIFRDEEPIVINNFLVDNLNPLPPLYIPELEEVHINYLYPHDSTRSFKAYLNNLVIQDALLFFKKTEEYGQNTLSTLWIDNLNVGLEVNGVMILKLSHKNESLTISRITPAAPSILEGLNFDTNVRELHLEEIPVDFVLLPNSSLEVLTLRNVRGQTNRIREFIRECKNLRYLSINNMNGETLDIFQDFGLFDENGVRHIHKIAVGNANLDCSSQILGRLEHSPVQELYLDGCTWTREFLKAIPFIFPCLKKCNIGSSTNYVPMIRDLLDISTLEWLGVWELEFIESNSNKRNSDGVGLLPLDYLEAKAKVKQILTQAELGDNPIWLNETKKTFVLQKLTNPIGQGHWFGTKYEDVLEAKDIFAKLRYDQFGWSAFYSDYQLFQKLE